MIHGWMKHSPIYNAQRRQSPLQFMKRMNGDVYFGKEIQKGKTSEGVFEKSGKKIWSCLGNGIYSNLPAVVLLSGENGLGGLHRDACVSG